MERVIFNLPKSLRQRIEDYRYLNRIRSEAEALRRLLEAGLKAEGRKK